MTFLPAAVQVCGKFNCAIQWVAWPLHAWYSNFPSTLNCCSKAGDATPYTVWSRPLPNANLVSNAGHAIPSIVWLEQIPYTTKGMLGSGASCTTGTYNSGTNTRCSFLVAFPPQNEQRPPWLYCFWCRFCTFSGQDSVAQTVN